MLQLLLLLLGRVTLVRGVAAYIVIKLSSGRSVGQSVCLSSHGPLYYQYRGPWSSALWKNGGLDPDAVWHRRSDGSRDEAGIRVWRSVHGKGYFWGEFGARYCPQGTNGRTCVTAPRRGPLAKLLWADLLMMICVIGSTNSPLCH